MLSEWSLEHATARRIDPNMGLLAFMGGGFLVLIVVTLKLRPEMGGTTTSHS